MARLQEPPADIESENPASQWANKKVTEVCQRLLCGINAAKIIQLVARSKFT